MKDILFYNKFIYLYTIQYKYNTIHRRISGFNYMLLSYYADFDVFQNVIKLLITVRRNEKRILDPNNESSLLITLIMC